MDIFIGNSLDLENISINGETGEVNGNLKFYSLPYYQNYPLIYGSAGHKYEIEWTDTELLFWVDNTNQTSNISDKRLKTEIKEVDKDLIKAIGQLEYKQFKKINRNGLISVGIIAQDLIEILNKYGKNAKDYEILEEFQYKLDDETMYYGVNYEQFLLLRMMAKEQEIEELKEKDKQKDEIIQDLIKRIEKLEGGSHE